MATDAENDQMFQNAPGPSTSQSPGQGTQIPESHPGQSLGLSKQRVEVTVLRADNVPSIKKHLFKNRMFFVTVSNPETTAKTADVPVERQMAKWNQILDPFLVQPSSRLTLCLYAKRSSHPDILIGTHEMRIPLSSQSDIQCVLGNGAGGAVRPTHPVTLHIKLNITPPNLHNSPPSIPIEDVDSPAEGATILLK